MLKTKSLACEFLKTISDQGIFEGMLSPYGNVDAGGDLVEAGAYTKTLQEGGPKRPLLWQHMSDCPIGELTLEDRKDGLWCRGKLLLSLPEAKKAYECLKAGIVDGLSIGYQTIRDKVEAGVRHLQELKLFEGSIVTFPMNELAAISSIKSEDENRIREALHELKTEVLSALKGK
jgi:HK97 family phage prohead protease